MGSVNTTPFSGSITVGEPFVPTYRSTAERLRAKADQVGPLGLGYISAAELRAIADELDA